MLSEELGSSSRLESCEVCVWQLIPTIWEQEQRKVWTIMFVYLFDARSNIHKTILFHSIKKVVSILCDICSETVSSQEIYLKYSGGDTQ